MKSHMCTSVKKKKEAVELKVTENNHVLIISVGRKIDLVLIFDSVVTIAS
jgi:hypothetical protein